MTRRPSFNLTDILRRRDRLFTQVLSSRVGEALNGDGLDQLAIELRRVLPSGVTRDAVFESARHLAGREVTHVLAYQLAWRLAGNLGNLRDGQPVPPWSVQHDNEWVPVQVLRCFTARDNRDRIGNEVAFRVMAGSSCPMRISTFWRKHVIGYVATRVGFSKPWGDYAFHKAEQLVGLRFLVYVEAAKSRAYPEFHEIECPQSLIKWNRENVLRLRLRVNGQRCPQGWTHECHRCMVGYGECPAATHRLNYEVGSCTQCQQDNVPFDPEEQSYYCISCNYRNRLRRLTDGSP